MLKVDGIDTNYGAVAMLRDVSFDVAEGEFVCILGPNGAGKRRRSGPCRGCFPSPVAASNSWGSISRGSGPRA